jgi:uncharacterized protein YciI
MYLLTVHYSKPLTEVTPHKATHRDWVQKYTDEGVFLIAGPNKAETGGLIIAKSIDKNKLKKIISEDSYVQADVAEYQITDFVCGLTDEKLEWLKSA